MYQLCRHNVDFVVTGNNAGCRFDNLRCHISDYKRLTLWRFSVFRLNIHRLGTRKSKFHMEDKTSSFFAYNADYDLQVYHSRKWSKMCRWSFPLYLWQKIIIFWLTFSLREAWFSRVKFTVKLGFDNGLVLYILANDDILRRRTSFA